jgi:hypothetical protein
MYGGVAPNLSCAAGAEPFSRSTKSKDDETLGTGESV